MQNKLQFYVLNRNANIEVADCSFNTALLNLVDFIVFNNIQTKAPLPLIKNPIKYMSFTHFKNGQK